MRAPHVVEPFGYSFNCVRSHCSGVDLYTTGFSCVNRAFDKCSLPEFLQGHITLQFLVSEHDMSEIA